MEIKYRSDETINQTDLSSYFIRGNILYSLGMYCTENAASSTFSVVAYISVAAVM
jgi:hypothetical protein